MTIKNCLKDANILIVDDLVENLELFNDLLMGEGCEVRPANNGKLALNAAFAIPPDLILLDIKMPEMNGFEVCRRLKSNPITENIPIIFLTAKSDMEDIVKGFELGAADYITKPFHSEEVLSRIKTHLDLSLSKKIIEEKNKAQRQLIHLLCHDLTNSIGSIKTVTDIVKSEKEQLSEYDILIGGFANNALEIISLVKKISSLKEGKIEIILEPENLKDLINHTLSIIGEKFTKKNIQPIINIADDIVVNVEITSFINSVVSNLLTNAIKFSFSGSKVMITAKETETDVILSVEDFGLGMPVALCNNIFEINKPTTRPGTHGETGTGFGMPLVKDFVEAYGGTIHVESQEKQDANNKHGTKFFIHLPKETK